MKKKYIILFITILIAGILFYLHDQYAIFMGDDYAYGFVLDKNKSYVDQIKENEQMKPIQDMYDVINSEINCYYGTNGRFIVHCTVQYLCAFVGMYKFVIFNSIMFCLLLFFVFKICIQGKNNNLLKYCITIACIWFFMPNLSMTFLGNITCSVDYLWVSVAILGFYCLYKYFTNHSANFILNTILFLYAVFCGSLSESFSIGFAGALFLYYCFNIKKLNKTLIFIIIGFFIGTAICVFAPGNFKRSEGSLFSLDNMYFFLGAARNLAIIVFLITLIVFYYRNKDRTKLLLSENIILLLSIIINILFCLFIAYGGNHQLTCISLCCIIITLRFWFDSFHIKPRYSIYFISIIVLLICIASYFLISMRRDVYNAHQSFILNAKQSKNGVAICKDYLKLCTVVKNNIFYNRYIMADAYMGYDFHKKGLSLYLTHGENSSFIKIIIPDTFENIEKLFSEKENICNQLSDGYCVLCFDKFYPVQDVGVEHTYSAFYIIKKKYIQESGDYFCYNDKYYYLYPSLYKYYQQYISANVWIKNY